MPTLALVCHNERLTPLSRCSKYEGRPSVPAESNRAHHNSQCGSQEGDLDRLPVVSSYIQFGALALAVFALALFINASACFILRCNS